MQVHSWRTRMTFVTFCWSYVLNWVSLIKFSLFPLIKKLEKVKNLLLAPTAINYLYFYQPLVIVFLIHIFLFDGKIWPIEFTSPHFCITYYVYCSFLHLLYVLGFFYFVTLLKIRWQTTVALFRYIVFVTCITKMPFFSLQLGLIINDNKKCPTLYKCSDNFNRYPKAFVIKIQPLLWLCLIVFPICIQSRRVCEVLTSQTIAVCTWQYHTERRSKELISSLLKLLFPPLVKSCCFMVQHRQGGGKAPPKKKKGRFSLQGQCTHNGLLSCSQTYCWLQERCECVCFWAIVCIWKWVCIWWCVCV